MTAPMSKLLLGLNGNGFIKELNPRKKNVEDAGTDDIANSNFGLVQSWVTVVVYFSNGD